MTAEDQDRQTFIQELYAHLLGRPPGPAELTNWVAALSRGLPEKEAFRRFVASPEYKSRHRVSPGFPSGHFYSPVVDPQEAKSSWERSSQAGIADLHGIHIDVAAMEAFWASNAACLRKAPFTKQQGGATRYYYDDRRYPRGDALILMAMINTYRPSRIIEIGSGFSSAVMLDTADHLNLNELRLTCIDPFADRLRSLLRPDDTRRVKILEQMVQDVPLDVFDTLEANDILFIDSSHVLKTGSDVHFELFSILPRLKPGVFVHFHDIHFPFEYPAEWVFEKRWSWNEIYALRAFLTDNPRFQIRFFTDFFLKTHPALVSETIIDAGFVVGGSLWIEKN